MLLGNVDRAHTNATVLDRTSGRPLVPHTVGGLWIVCLSGQWWIEMLVRAPLSHRP